MIERGTVKEIKGQVLTVQLELQEGCEACNNSSCKDKRNEIQAWNRDSIALKEGEWVEVEIQGKAQLSGAFWVLAMPLVLFAAGYFAGTELFPGKGEGPAALCAFVALVIGIVGGILVQKGRKFESLPLVLRAYEPEVETALPKTTC